MRTQRMIAAVLFSVALFGSCRPKTAEDTACITVNVSAEYPKKELAVQDMMDVEYVPLETTDEFITNGNVKAVGKHVIVTTNYGRNGDIFLFDRATGKALKKINRMGQSGEEYTTATEIVLDEDQNELFVVDYAPRKVLVYDLEGNFKRSFHNVDSAYYTNTFNYDKEHLLTYKTPAEGESGKACHVLLSKQDGSKTKEIGIPFDKPTSLVFTEGEFTITPQYFLTIPNGNDWVLTKMSADTIYNYRSDETLEPFIVRTPSIHEMETQVFLFPMAITDRYYFVKAQKKEFDFTKMKGFPSTNLVYDKQEKALFESAVYNNDFTDKREIYLGSQPINQEVPICQPLDAADLIEDYKENNLQGKLKEIAANLDEESNPVLLLVKRKQK